MFKKMRRIIPGLIKKFVMILFGNRFFTDVIYKYPPRIFLLGRFGICGGEINSSDYWSSIHKRETGTTCFCFDHMVVDLLTNVGLWTGCVLFKLSPCKSIIGVDISPEAIMI